MVDFRSRLCDFGSLNTFARSAAVAEGHVAHRAAALAWLSPSAPRLAALADAAMHAANDPASVLLLLRFARPTPTIDSVSIDPEDFQQSSILEAAATYLESNAEG